MKSIFLRITIGCLITLLFVHSTIAQSTVASADSSPANSQSNNQIAEPMGEDDRLPFMQNERSTNQTETSAGGMLLRTLGAMLLIVGTIFFGAWGLRKFGANLGWFQPNNAIVHDAPELIVVNTVNLGNGRTLAVVKFGDRNLLVGATAQSFTLLVDHANDEQSEPRPNRSVAEMLAAENVEDDDAFASQLTAADLRLNVFDFKQS